MEENFNKSDVGSKRNESSEETIGEGENIPNLLMQKNLTKKSKPSRRKAKQGKFHSHNLLTWLFRFWFLEDEKGQISKQNYNDKVSE